MPKDKSQAKASSTPTDFSDCMTPFEIYLYQFVDNDLPIPLELTDKATELLADAS